MQTNYGTLFASDPSFTSVVGKANATGMMVPNGWYPGYANPASQAMVQEYVAKYGGFPSKWPRAASPAWSARTVPGNPR